MGGMVHTVWSCPDGVPGVGGSFAVLTAETGYAVPEFHCFDRALPVSTSSWSVLREAALWTLSGVVSRAGRDPRGEQQNGKGRGASTQQRLTIPRSVWVTRMEEGARAVGIGRVPWRVLWRCLADPGFDPQIAVPARQKHVKEQRRSVEHVSVSIPSAYRWHNKVEANWLATWGADVSSMILPLIDSVRDTLSKEAKQSHRFNHFSPKITEDASAFSPGERHLVADRVAGLARGLPVPAICYALLLYEHAAHDRKLGRTRGKGDRAETISKALLGLWVFFRGEDGSSAVTDSSLGFRLKIHFGDEVAGGVEEAEFVRFALEHCDLRRLFPETSSRRETAAWVALARSLQSSNGFVSVDALTEAVLSVENFLVHAPSTASSLFLDLSRSADSIASCLLNEHVRAETLDDEQDTPNPKPSQNASLVTPRNPRWVVDMSSFIKACALHLTDGEVTSDELGIDGRVKAFDYERALLLWRLLAGGAGGNGVAEASRVLDALDTGVPGQGRSEGVVLGVWREEWRLVSRAPVVNACVTAAVVVATALCCDPASLLLLGKGAARKAPFPLSSPPRAGAGPHRSAEAGHGPDVAPHATGAHAALAAANRIDQKRVVSLRAAEEAAMLSVSTGGGKPAAAPHREPPASPDTHAPHPKTPPPPAPVPQQQQEQHQQQQDQPPQPGPASSPPRGELTLADALSAATATVVVARHRPAKKAAAGAGGKPGEEKEPAGKKRAGPPNAQPRAWVRRKGEERGEDAGFAFGSLRVLPGTGRGTNARARLRFEAAAAAAGGERARLSADLPRTPTEAAALLRLAFTLEAWRVPHDLFRSEMFVPPDGSVRASPIPPGGTSPGARHEAGRVSNLSKQRNVSVSAVRRSILDTLVVLETVFGSLETGLSEAAGHDFLSFLSFLSRASADASLPDHLRLLGGESDKGDAAMLPGDPENLQPPPQVAPGGGFLHGLLCAAAAALKSRRKQVFGAVTPLAAREVRKREDLAGGQPGELPQSTGKAPQPKREQKEDTEAPGSGSRGGLHYEAMHAQDVEAFKAALRDKVSERRTRMELRGMVAIGTPVVLKDGTLGSVMEAVDKGRGKLVVRVKKGKLGGGGYRHVDPSDVTFATDFAKRDLLNELGTVPHQRSSLGIAKKNGEYGLGLGMPATPLHFACLALREDIVDYLVAEGADPGVSCVEEGRGGVTCRQLCAANAVASKKRAKEEERRAAEVTKELTESRKLEALALAEMSIRTTDEREAREERRIARKDETRASARAAGGGGTQAPSKPASAKRRDSGSSSASYSSSSSQPATHRRKPKKKKFFHRETSSSSGLDDSTKLGKTIKVALKADKDPSKGGAKGTAKTANAVEAALQAHGSKADAGDSNTDLTDSSSGGDTDDSSEPPETSENKELLEKSRRLATASEALETEHKAALLQASKHQAAARLYKRLAAKLLAWSQNTTRSRRKAGDPDPGEEAGRPADTGGAKGSGGLVVATVVKDGELCLTEASVKSVCSCLAAGGVPSLNLGNIALGADGGGASRILELLQNAPLVASLNLRNCGLSEEHGLALAAALRSPNCKLQELFLWNNMELRGTASLAILDAARSHAYLHTLDLSATGMTHRECQLARRRVFATSLHLLVDIAPTTPSHTRSSPTRTLLPVHTVKAQIETLKQSYLTHRIPQPPSPTSAQPTAEAQPIPPTKPEDQVNPAAGKVLPPATKRPGSQAKVEKKVVVLREVEIINVSVSSEDASGDENEEKMRYLKQAEQEAYDAKLKEEAKRLAASGG
ncbi:hypothetical protein DIPPA_24024 [Diplonema papillatum]|nr:hypothetical protein DIPPA_24024 [Diplonema papillatum]